jgi:hypothetical protein
MHYLKCSLKTCAALLAIQHILLNLELDFCCMFENVLMKIFRGEK